MAGYIILARPSVCPSIHSSCSEICTPTCIAQSEQGKQREMSSNNGRRKWRRRRRRKEGVQRRSARICLTLQRKLLFLSQGYQLFSSEQPQLALHVITVNVSSPSSDPDDYAKPINESEDLPELAGSITNQRVLKESRRPPNCASVRTPNTNRARNELCNDVRSCLFRVQTKPTPSSFKLPVQPHGEMAGDVPEILFTLQQDKNSTYWFEDGSLTLVIQNKSFKVHRSLVCRQSPYLSSLLARNSRLYDDGCSHATVDPDLEVSALDAHALFAHLYHDS